MITLLPKFPHLTLQATTASKSNLKLFSSSDVKHPKYAGLKSYCKDSENTGSHDFAMYILSARLPISHISSFLLQKNAKGHVKMKRQYIFRRLPIFHAQSNPSACLTRWINIISTARCSSWTRLLSRIPSIPSHPSTHL